MKKILFASTALIATAGVAAADVSFGGYGRFGMFYDDSNATRSTRIEQRFRLTATGTTTTDAGVKLEGRIRFQSDEADGTGANAAGAGEVANTSAAGFAVSYEGLRVDVGHVSDVIDSGDVVNYYGYGVGLTSFLEQSSGYGLKTVGGFGTSAAGSAKAPTVKVRYTTGGLTVAASYTDDLSATAAGDYQVGIGYAFGDYNVGAAYGNTSGTTDDAFWAISGDATFGNLGVAVLIADYDDGSDVRYGVSANYAVSSATDLRFVANDNGTATDSSSYGIGVRHDLGGGVTVAGGVGEVAGATKADLGVIFKF